MIFTVSIHTIMGFSETSGFVNFKDLGHFNEGVMKATNFSLPKHPAVIQITKKKPGIGKKMELRNKILKHRK